MRIENINEITDVLKRISTRLDELAGTNSYDGMVVRLESLTRYHNEPMDYPEPTKVVFPSTVTVAYAVCHPECGKEEFIVDGSTQLCDRCGSTMFRTDVGIYKLVDSRDEY